MKYDFTPVYVAFGLGLATYLFLRLKKVKSPVKFKDIFLDKSREEISLVVENLTGKPVFVKPALRLVKLTPVNEWKEKTSNGNGVDMMTASAGSVIKGYELLGEYAHPIHVPPKTSKKVSYPLMREFGLKAYDDIKIDADFGQDEVELSGNTSATLRLNTRKFLSDDDAQELLTMLEDYIQNAGLEYESEGQVSEVVELKSKQNAVSELDTVGDIEATPIREEYECTPDSSPDVDDSLLDKDFKKSEFPIESMCFCCGKKRWLNWVVEENHVCNDCKSYLIPDDHGLHAGIADPSGGEIPDSSMDNEVEVVLSEPVDLKPRHDSILDILHNENAVFAKDIAKKVGRKEKNISTDLRELMNIGLVDRVKIGRSYKYFILNDSDHVILHDKESSDDSLQCT